MLRHVFLALTVTLAMGTASNAGPVLFDAAPSPYGPLYSPSSSPFESFQWTPLDFGAFSAYGGDFSNVRRPVTPLDFFEEPVSYPLEQRPDDEQYVMRLLSVPYFEEIPQLAAMSQEETSQAAQIPEPGALLLVGLALLGASARLHRAYRNR